MLWRESGRLIGEGNFNSAFGYYALIKATGSGNASFGVNKLANVPPGDLITAFGSNGGASLITGTSNTLIGKG